METLDTIRTNALVLANAEIDWSPHGGMFWLAGMFLITAVGMVGAALSGVK